MKSKEKELKEWAIPVQSLLHSFTPSFLPSFTQQCGSPIQKNYPLGRSYWQQPWRLL